MTVITTFPLADGPLSLDAIREQRSAKVAEMAYILVEKRCFDDYADSIMVLAEAGFSRFEVMALLADARDAARWHVQELMVATEMSAS